MQAVSIYHYQSARLFIKEMIEQKKKSEADFSIRKFCRQTGLGSHSLLIMLLNGKRRVTLKQVPSFSSAFHLNSSEQLYFQTLIQLDNARSEEEAHLCKLWLNDINPRPDLKIVEVDQFQVIANWIHVTILTLAKIEGLEINAANVFALVKEKVSLSECKKAIERLVSLNLLKFEDGKLKSAQAWVRTKDDVANRGAREYHSQVGKLALEALEEQDVGIREFQSFALTVPKEKISFAKDLIRKFRNQLVLTLEAEAGQEVYQCNVQFFRLTESPLTLVSAVNEGAKIQQTPRIEESALEGILI